MSVLSDVRVQIFGSEYRIASETDPEHIRKVANYIDQKMREIASALALRTRSTVAVLTAVNLADELFKIEEEDRRIDRLSREKADQLADSVNL
ncbi:MAG: cell division protein ZapA [Gemmatimonadota bacterium]|nr:cell division protein ZapA [Gemmatimonadota bacterium]MDE2832705.1 cell division protein ZapA [Gemmatimonadota bacterium]MDE2953873.1 cell division protein ZapA [Gemmatimonadota bacterium]